MGVCWLLVAVMCCVWVCIRVCGFCVLLCVYWFRHVVFVAGFYVCLLCLYGRYWFCVWLVADMCGVLVCVPCVGVMCCCLCVLDSCWSVVVVVGFYVFIGFLLLYLLLVVCSCCYVLCAGVCSVLLVCVFCLCIGFVWVCIGLLVSMCMYRCLYWWCWLCLLSLR